MGLAGAARGHHSITEDDEHATVAQIGAAHRRDGGLDVARPVGIGVVGRTLRARQHDGAGIAVKQVEEHRGLLEGVRAVQHHHADDARIVERRRDRVPDLDHQRQRHRRRIDRHHIADLHIRIGERHIRPPAIGAMRPPAPRALAIVPPVVSTTTAKESS